MHLLFHKRFGRNSSNDLSINHVPSAAVGVLINKMDEATQFFKLLIKAFNKKWFTYQDYPIFYFMLRLMADYIKEPLSPFESGKIEKEIVFHELFKVWRNENPESIRELCLAVCDYHTHQCKPDKGNLWHEFNNGYWSGWPIEINLLFKLRELLGLKNPTLDHPLMNTPLGQLPTNVSYELDELSNQVLAKMRTQGFDENEVFEKIYFERF
jgi:hypothetical protein